MSDTARWVTTLLVSVVIGGGVGLGVVRYMLRLVVRDKLKQDFILREEFDAYQADVNERFERLVEDAVRPIKEIVSSLHHLTNAVSGQTVEIKYLRDDVHDLKQRKP